MIVTAGTRLGISGAWLALAVIVISGAGQEDRTPLFPKVLPSPTTGAMWRQPIDDWEGARRRVETDQTWADWVTQRRARVDDWMTRRSDRVSWVAGWGHEFVSPRDGSYLTFTPEVPGEDVMTLSSPSDPEVAVTPTIFRAWVTKFRGRHIIMIKDAAQLGRLTGEDRYSYWAAAQLDFYAEHWTDWPLQDRFYGPSRLFGQPLMDAAYLNHLLVAVRLLSGDVDAERRARWRDQLFLPQAALMGQSMQRVHNIAGYLRGAAAHVGLVFDNESLWQEAIDGEWGLRRQLADGVTRDYLWFEQSIGYHEFALAGILPVMEAAAMAGRGADLEREMAIVRQMLIAPNAWRFPDNRLPNPADNAALRLRDAPLRQVLRRSYRLLPSSLALAEASDARTWSTLLEPPAIVGEVPAVTPPMAPVTSRHGESIRLAQLRAEGWQVFFHYGQLTPSHAQADLLNFEAYFGDTSITLDPHTVGYGSPLHQEWFTRGLAHNVPLVDGLGSAPPSEAVVPHLLPQRGEAVIFDAKAQHMAASQPAYQEGVTARRSLLIEHGALHDQVRLNVEDGRVRLLGLSLHLQARIETRDTMMAAPDFATDRPAAFGHWQDVVRDDFKDQAVFNAQCPDGQRLRISFSVPGSFTVAVGSVPDSPVPQRRMAFYLETTGSDAEIKTVITPVEQVVRKAEAGSKSSGIKPDPQ